MRSSSTAPVVRRSVNRILPAAVAAAALVLAGVPGVTAVPVAAAADSAVTAPVLTGGQLTASWTGPLSTQGRYTVDAKGDRFKLKSANWAGAQGTWEGSGDVDDPANNQAGQVSHNIPLGLDRVPMAQLMSDFHGLGINSVRLPFANAMIHDTTTVPDAAVTANPQLRGKTPLQVYDAVVAALTADGFAVVLNNHTTSYRFCCSLDGNERWNSGQSTQQWVDDWVFLVNRYKANKRVVGADLRNEVRRDTWDDPNWGTGDSHDLYKAFEEAGNAILEADPDMLIVMEGINWQGIPQGMFSHGRPMLTPVGHLSNTLVRSGKLVYAAHFYGYTGPNHTGASGGWQNGETNDPRYQDLSPEELVKVVGDQALFVTEAGQHFTAPVWISEFGAAGRGSDNGKEKDWFDRFTDILASHDTDFAMWPLVGWTDANGKPNDNWALISYDAKGKRYGLQDGGDWRVDGWNQLVNAPGRTGQVDKVDHWNMLSLSGGDQNLSITMRAKGDWSYGNYKAACPDSERLIALGRGNSSGLCTDADEPAAGSGDLTVVNSEKYVTSDWAWGYNKIQCPDDTFAAGYSANGSIVALVCRPSAAPLPTGGRTIWFDHGDNRPTTGGSVQSDWAAGYYKGQCKDDEYIAGVAMTWRWNEHGVPDALLCRPLK
ncbi:glycoside hydrolase family 5 protein [Kitasatospora sp. NBC_01246]|uniref:glycoside hydrolase family 5 protein n=1 Tax=Kitasatospora sp. NBC_01246 TaxID=2903570 RepID=UPI002E30F462|nr:cellulase family glycosylhydrolase [Kitasatospora sp. NBC_01246]